MLLKCGVEKTLESPLDCKDIQPVHPKGVQSWIFFGRTDVEAEAPILWPPDSKSSFIGKDSDAEKDWRQEEKRPTEDEMVGWHHWLNGHEFEQALGDGEGQGSLACCRPWGCKESDMTEWTTRTFEVEVPVSTRGVAVITEVSTRRQHFHLPASGSSDNQSLRESVFLGCELEWNMPEQIPAGLCLTASSL